MPDPGMQPQSPTDGQPPFGSSPATGATANDGASVAGAQQIGIVIKALEKILPLVGSSSELGQEVLKSIKGLAKYVPAGSVTPAAEQNQLQAAQIRSVQNGQNAALLRQQQAQQQGGGAPAAPGA